MDVLELVKKPFADLKEWCLRQIEIGKLKAKIELDEEAIEFMQDRLAGNQRRLAELEGTNLEDSPPPNP